MFDLAARRAEAKAIEGFSSVLQDAEN